MGIFRRFIKRKDEKDSELFSQDLIDKHYRLKTEGLELVLGKQHPETSKASLPFDLGGSVNMYHYPNVVKGTGFATKELILPNGTGPLPNQFGTYELVAFTKLSITNENDGFNAFSEIERRLCGIFTNLGNYGQNAMLQPEDTCELPFHDGNVACLIFDHFKPQGKEFLVGNDLFHLLLVIEIFRDELEFARTNGSKALLSIMKAKSIYPYSDLDRKSVLYS